MNLGRREHASFIRHAVIGIWFVTFAATPYQNYAHLPRELFSVPGLAGIALDSNWILDLVLRAKVLLGLRIAGVALAVGAMCLRDRRGLWIRLTAVVAVILDGLTKGFGGFVNHAQAVPLTVLMVCAVLARWDFLSLSQLLSGNRDKHSEQSVMQGPDAWSAFVRLVAAVLVIPYSYIAINRIARAGTDLVVGDTFLYYFAGASNSFTSYPAWFPRNSTLLRCGFILTTLLEVFSLGVLWRRWFRLWWLATMCVVHIAICFLMNIFFWENMILAITVLWPPWQIESVPGSRCKSS